MLFLGFTILFGGLMQFNTKQQANSKVSSKDNKVLGIFSIIFGVVIIVVFIFKMIEQ